MKGKAGYKIQTLVYNIDPESSSEMHYDELSSDDKAAKRSMIYLCSYNEYSVN